MTLIRLCLISLFTLNVCHGLYFPPYPTELTINIGTNSDDSIVSMCWDNSKENFWVVGITEGQLLSEPNQGGKDIFLFKYSSTGSRVASLQIGTEGDDYVTAGAVDPQDNLIIIGRTDGNITGNVTRGFDIFIAKFNESGEIWLKTFGGPEFEDALGLTLEGTNAYVVGYTTGMFEDRTPNGITESYILKVLGDDGSQLWLDNRGTVGHNFISRAVTFNNAQNAVYVIGETDAPVLGIETEWSGGYDIVLMKYFPGGGRSGAWIFGSSNDDFGYSIIIANHAIYVAGFSNGNLGGNTNSGSYDVAWMQFNDTFAPTNTKLIGGSGSDQAFSMVHSNGYFYLAGKSNGNVNGVNNKGNGDALVLMLDDNGDVLWTQLIGTNQEDYASCITIDNDNNLWIVGTTNGDIGSGYYGLSDGFIIKLNFSEPISTTGTTSIDEVTTGYDEGTTGGQYEITTGTTGDDMGTTGDQLETTGTTSYIDTTGTTGEQITTGEFITTGEQDDATTGTTGEQQEVTTGTTGEEYEVTTGQEFGTTGTTTTGADQETTGTTGDITSTSGYIATTGSGDEVVTTGTTGEIETATTGLTNYGTTGTTGEGIIISTGTTGYPGTTGTTSSVTTGVDADSTTSETTESVDGTTSSITSTTGSDDQSTSGMVSATSTTGSGSTAGAASNTSPDDFGTLEETDDSNNSNSVIVIVVAVVAFVTLAAIAVCVLIIRRRRSRRSFHYMG